MRNLSEQVRGGTFCLSCATLAIGGTGKNDVSITAPNGAGIDFCINGYAYHKADADDIPITAAAAQAASTSCLYLVCVDSSGTISSVKGDEVLTADLTAGEVTLKWPAPVADTCPIGAARVDVAAGYTFTAGTTTFDATGMTDTFYSFFAVPDEDLTS